MQNPPDGGTAGNIIIGNYIGTNQAGAALGNGGNGIYIFNTASGNRAGGGCSAYT